MREGKERRRERKNERRKEESIHLSHCPFNCHTTSLSDMINI